MKKVDDLTKEQRRKNMKNIHSQDTKIETTLRKVLWHNGYRFRKNYTKLPGKPDIVLSKYKIAIFCDSEFFHGKYWDIQRKRFENTENGAYWIKKIERNILRDISINQQLSFLGWTVLRFWGRDILKDSDKCVHMLEETIFDNILQEHTD